MRWYKTKRKRGSSISVAFYGDCILSRACHEDVIVLWRIEGFSSADPPPSPDVAPTAHDTSRLTRSAFTPSTSASGQAQYTRLLQFHTPGCGPQFFMRFSMFHVAGHHPMLGFCNASSRIFFWDLARLTSYHEYVSAVRDPDRDKSVPVPRPDWLKPIAHRKKAADSRPADSRSRVAREANRDKDSDRDSSLYTTGTPDPDKIELLSAEYSTDTIDDWEKKYNMDDPHNLLKPHKVEITKGFSIVGRQVAWSPEGEWCVIVGSDNRAIIMQRWAGENLTGQDEGAE